MTMQTSVDVASEVRAAMARKRVKQNQLAEALGLHQSAISRRLSGEIEFSITDLVAIAKLLDVPLADLLPIPALVSPGDVPSSPDADGTSPAEEEPES